MKTDFINHIKSTYLLNIIYLYTLSTYLKKLRTHIGLIIVYIDIHYTADKLFNNYVSDIFKIK